MLLILLSCSPDLSGPAPEGRSNTSLKVLNQENKITASDGSANDAFGQVTANAGDINGDGYDDILVGSYTSSEWGSGDSVVYVYYGSAGGIDEDSEEIIGTFTVSTKRLVSKWLSGAGDINGDGFDDVIVGAAEEGNGAAYIYYGSSSGLDISSPDTFEPNEQLYWEMYYGHAVSGAGDVNGDGYDDVVIGSIGYVPNDGWDVGCAYVYHGSSSGLTTNERIILENGTGGLYNYFGSDVGGVGDLNSDGYDDISISAQASTYVYYGSNSGIDNASEAELGGGGDGAMSGAGDFNGDGHDDLATSCWWSSCSEFWVYYGGGGEVGLNTGDGQMINATDGATNISLAEVVASVGDIDGDGYDDLVVSAADDDDNGTNAGAIYVYYGSSTGISDSNGEKIFAADGASGDAFGYSVSSAGDVNGDGAADLMAGAPSDDDNGSASGSVYVFHSGCDDEDGDGVCASEDCDDDDDEVGAAEIEICDGVDNDCDGLTDGADDDVSDAGTWYADSDGDGYGDPDSERVACNAPSGYVDNSGDCDDGDAAINPGATEVDGDGIDSDCDGSDDVGSDDTDDTGEGTSDDTGSAPGGGSDDTGSGGSKNSGSCAHFGAPALGGWLISMLVLGLRRRTPSLRRD